MVACVTLCAAAYTGGGREMSQFCKIGWSARVVSPDAFPIGRQSGVTSNRTVLRQAGFAAKRSVVLEQGLLLARVIRKS